jgi:primosomal protein N' (replication factor Y)
MGNFSSFATVIVDEMAVKPLDYGIPEKMSVNSGNRVLVTLRNKIVKGTVLFIRNKSPFKEVSPILEVVMDEQKIPPDLFELANWISDYYASPLRYVLKSILPSSVRDDKNAKQKTLIERLLSKPKTAELAASLRSKHPSQALVLDMLLEKEEGVFLSCLLEKVSSSPIETLIKNKVLKKTIQTIDRSYLIDEEYFPTFPKKLSREQEIAFNRVKESLDQNAFKTYLLHGVTGSGKTEVYLQLIQRALDMEKSVILLVPEIALTVQTIERLKGRLQIPIAILHSRLSHGEKLDAWKSIHSGKIKVVVGARSAIFSPVQNLGLIIVDEEQESSYKSSDEMPCYNGRDVAIMRAKICKAVALLGSATPSLESYHNAEIGKYELLKLTTRPKGSELPKVTIVDMLDERETADHPYFSNTLLNKMIERASKGEQTILFLNRRGTYSLLKCQKCDYVAECPHCDQNLTFHRSEHTLSCHLCGFCLSPPPIICPKCKSSETFKFRSPGTDQIERSLKAMFPSLRLLRIDGDTTRKKGSHDELFKEFKAGKADVLIGTQMIAKGLHFPSVTLVGVLNSDGALSIPDFRSHENVFSLMTQVAGRSGRSHLPGEVVIQTRSKDHPIIEAASQEDYLSFYRREIEGRKLFDYPPFTHLIKCMVTGEEEKETFEFGKKIRAYLIERLPGIYTLTPLVPAGTAKIKDRYRFQFLLKGKNPLKASAELKALYEEKRPKGISFLIDVDPRETY